MVAGAQDESDEQSGILRGGVLCVGGDEDVFEFTFSRGHIVGFQPVVGDELADGGECVGDGGVEDVAACEVHALPLGVQEPQGGCACVSSDGHFRFASEPAGGRGGRRFPCHVTCGGDGGKQGLDVVLSVCELDFVGGGQVGARLAFCPVKVVAVHCYIVSRNGVLACVGEGGLD